MCAWRIANDRTLPDGILGLKYELPLQNSEARSTRHTLTDSACESVCKLLTRVINQRASYIVHCELSIQTQRTARDEGLVFEDTRVVYHIPE